MIDQTRMDKLAVMGYDFSGYDGQDLKKELGTVKEMANYYNKEVKAIEAELRLRGVK